MRPPFDQVNPVVVRAGMLGVGIEQVAQQLLQSRFGQVGGQVEIPVADQKAEEDEFGLGVVRILVDQRLHLPDIGRAPAPIGQRVEQGRGADIGLFMCRRRGHQRLGPLQGLPFLAAVPHFVVGRDGVIDAPVRHGRAAVQARRFRKGQHRLVVPEAM